MSTIKMSSIFLYALLVGWGTASIAGEAEDLAAIGASLAQLVPGKPDTISKTPMSGIYQAVYGMNTYYLSADGRFLLTGDLIDIKERRNLTQEQGDQARKKEMSNLNVNEMIVYPATAQEKHVISVFTDIDCGYCRKLHAEMEETNRLGITVRYLAYPRAGVGSPSYNKIVGAWCEDDRKQALTDAKIYDKISDKRCDNPVQEHIALAKKFGVSGTPAIVTDAGVLIPGYMPSADLLKRLNQL